MTMTNESAERERDFLRHAITRHREGMLRGDDLGATNRELWLVIGDLARGVLA